MADTTVLRISGRLDGLTYRQVRDSIVTAALSDVRAVIVDVDDLEVPAESAWSVFASARWLVTRWPEVPIFLVCSALAGRRAIARNGVSRYVPVYANRTAALQALADAPLQRYRRRVRAQLPAGTASLPHARRLETDGATVTVAVEDDNPAPPVLSEDREAADAPSGLRTVAKLVRAWGTAPSPPGKTVWAVLGPENRI
ncbi:STAS domain-containing protein [Mycolicibacterium thermoresistibile]